MNLTGEDLLNTDKDKETVNAILARRNLKYTRGFCTKNLIFDMGSISPSGVLQLYKLLKRYSFRLYLREIIKLRESFRTEFLLKFSGINTIENYTRAALEIDIIEKTGIDGEYKLKRDYIETFGDTLEWFVSRMMRFEFGSPSGWSIKLQTSGVGGDYDVLGLLENHLVYIETKSSPPAHIDQSSIVEFVSRINTLAPQMAVFLVDTGLRMKDKIVPALEHVIRSFGIDCEMRNICGENFHFNHSIYIINSRISLESNLRKVFADFLLNRGLKL